MPSPQAQGGISTLVRLPHDASSARTARRWAVDAVSAAGVAPEVVDDVALVVSELVTNAVRHAAALPGGTIEVCVVTGVPNAAVQLRVTDGGGPTLPTLPSMPPASRPSGGPLGAATVPLSGGRGLSIVSSVVDHWGVDVDPSGSTTVWAELRSRQARNGVADRPA